MNNKQKMTRTTELLKGCGTSDAVPYEDDYVCCGHDNGHWEEQEYQDGDHTHKEDIWAKQILLCKNCKSQLRGRLDALKEEEIWFSKFNLNKLRNECEDENGVTNAMVYGFYLWFRDRLASIQEEIKLIEGKI